MYYIYKTYKIDYLLYDKEKNIAQSGQVKRGALSLDHEAREINGGGFLNAKPVLHAKMKKAKVP